MQRRSGFLCWFLPTIRRHARGLANGHLNIAFNLQQNIKSFAHGRYESFPQNWTIQTDAQDLQNHTCSLQARKIPPSTSKVGGCLGREPPFRPRAQIFDSVWMAFFVNALGGKHIFDFSAFAWHRTRIPGLVDVLGGKRLFDPGLQFSLLSGCTFWQKLWVGRTNSFLRHGHNISFDFVYC